MYNIFLHNLFWHNNYSNSSQGHNDSATFTKARSGPKDVQLPEEVLSGAATLRGGYEASHMAAVSESAGNEVPGPCWRVEHYGMLLLAFTSVFFISCGLIYLN